MASQLSLPFTQPDHELEPVFRSSYWEKEIFPYAGVSSTPRATPHRAEVSAAVACTPEFATPVLQRKRQASLSPPLQEPPRRRLRQKTTAVQQRSSPACAQKDGRELAMDPDTDNSKTTQNRSMYKRFHQHFNRWLCRCSKKDFKDVEIEPKWELFIKADVYVRERVLTMWQLQTRVSHDLGDWAMEYWTLSRQGRNADPMAARDKTTSTSPEKWFQGRTLLLTWNGDWGLLEPFAKDSELLGSVGGPFAEFASVKSGQDHVLEVIGTFCMWLAEREEVTNLRADLESHVKRVAAEHSFESYGFALELSTKTWLTDGTVRVHAHAFFASSMRRVVRHAAEYAFKRSKPVKSNQSNTRVRATGVAACAYYVTCPKVGSITQSSTLSANTDYVVQPQWIWNLLAAQKITAVKAREEFVSQCRDLPRLLAALDKFKAETRTTRLAKTVDYVTDMLAKQRRPFRRLEPVHLWLAEHKSISMRYKFLVLTGPSQTGKTQYALSLVGTGRCLELNMAATSEPDLRDYDHEAHDMILFDEMAASAVLLQKKLMQAPACLLGMASSKTNLYAYSVWVHAKLLVICSNRWDMEVADMPAADSDWLVQNSVVIRVHEALYIADSEASAASAEPFASQSQQLGDSFW